MHVSTFPTHPTSLSFSSLLRSFASSLSYGPRIPAGLFVTPVFPGIPDLELIFVGRKLCRSHSWINFAPSTNHRRTRALSFFPPFLLSLSLSLSLYLPSFIRSLRYYCIVSTSSVGSFRGEWKSSKKDYRKRDLEITDRSAMKSMNYLNSKHAIPT